jgi:hypothetical protein
MDRGIKLPIPPMKPHFKSKRENVPISRIRSGKHPEDSFEITNAVVAYIDILGFSEKTDEKEIEASLLDFYGSLMLSARQNPHVRFNIFSDCAFVAADVKNAADLLSAIRFAFVGWIADGILVRGGLAMGTYNEIRCAAQDLASGNVISSLFSGSGVTTAVRLEGSGTGALLFVDNKCSEYYNKKYKEPIFALKDHRIVGWSDEIDHLHYFASLSLLRLLKILYISDSKYDSIREKLLNNLIYSNTAANDNMFLLTLALQVLSLPVITPDIRESALDLLGIERSHFDYFYGELVDECKTWQNKDETKLLLALADMDSSIPQSLNFSNSYRPTIS